jgi:hypothetical protein
MSDIPNLTRDQQQLVTFATRCERNADELAANAADPAAALAANGGHDLSDAEVAAYGQRQQQAEAAARQYAAQLREQVASGEPVSLDDLKQADLVSHAAGVGGWLSDGRQSAETMPEDTDYDRQQKDGTREYHDERNAEIEATGMFDHVEIPGERRPRWQLRPTDQAQADSDAGTQAAEQRAVDVDEA